MAVTRCSWCGDDSLYVAYHDEEWGVPVFDDRTLFEFLILEGAQAGLSWSTILKKREGYRAAFDRFDPQVVARYAVQEEHGSFSDYIWGFVDGTPIQNQWRTLADIPATTPLAETISKDLKKRGFRFVGPTIIYAHMQATGMVNDHVVGCFRHPEIVAMSRKK